MQSEFLNFFSSYGKALVKVWFVGDYISSLVLLKSTFFLQYFLAKPLMKCVNEEYVFLMLSLMEGLPCAILNILYTFTH